jgi:hypothetical protein
MLKKIIFYLRFGRLSKATVYSHNSNSRHASSSSSKQQEGLHLEDGNNGRVTAKVCQQKQQQLAYNKSCGLFSMNVRRIVCKENLKCDCARSSTTLSA